ncbi:MAG: malonyl-CoA synthase [Rhodospirillaceae bacterium]|nr:malonyl-CoA synthase [Rhodospirillaceae bacterium]|tara:strand:+ start:890 stop:2395 length:1506 start_codon:yes stop_codon:yes gene_type:complete
MSNHFYDQTFGLHTASDHLFLKTEEGDISHTTFATMTARLSNALVAAGMSVGDRVAVQAEKSATLLGVCAATIRAGGVYLPLNTGYTPAEIDYFVSDARPVIIIVDPAAAADIVPLADRIGATLFTLDAAGEGTLAAAAKEASTAFDTVPRGGDDLAAILYTSGTTGRSKGARLSHHNLVSNAAVLADTWRFTRDDVLLHMLPIYHTHGLFVACNLMAMVGGTMIFLSKFSVEAALQWMPQATSMMGVPTFYTRLLASADFTAEASQHMRVFISGSAPLLAETHRAFSARTGKAILERYGMTETNMITSNPYDGDRRPGTVGMPLAGIDLRIADSETGKTCANGEIGIIELRGENVFQGYWEMPEKTAESFREDGFFITGDLAVRDADGYVSIVGRDKDLIITGGLNVYPREVESLVDELDGVQESAVIGVPHPDFGEAVVAIVVAGPGTVSANAVIEALAGRLAKFKQPKSVHLVDALPRNSMGKVQKAALRKEYAGLFT